MLNIPEIEKAIKRIHHENYDESLTTQVVEDIKKGLVDDMSKEQYYEFVASVFASYIYIEPEFSKVATYFEIEKYKDEIHYDYSKLIKEMQKYNKFSTRYLQFCEDYDDWINHILKLSRDYDIEYFGFKTIEKLYTMKDYSKKVLERPQHVFLRCAIELHAPFSEKVKETYDYMSQLYFTHASPTLFNSGLKYNQLSSCYLLQMPDDLNEIGDALKNMMQISKFGGGIGVNLSEIRARDSIIESNGGKSDGIIPLCKVVESVAKYVNQQGRRNGSIACYLEPWHADILEFLELRKPNGEEYLRCRDLFLGLWVPDLFMEQCMNDADWYLMTSNVSKGLCDVYGEEFNKLYWDYVNQGKYIKKMKARDLMKKIIETQIESGMPYMLYKDAINKKSNQQNLGTIKNSNLCAEIVEYSNESEIANCNLASICLPKFIQDGKFDFYEFGKVVRIVTENLNKVIDNNYYPTEECKHSNMKHRPIGIGVQGLADTYILLNLPFESKEANELNKKIFECLYYHALKASCELAKLHGAYYSFYDSPASFGVLQFDLWDEPHNKHEWSDLRHDIIRYGLRNSLLTALMPTASTSQIMGNNESIEPYASNLYVRKTMAGDFVVVNKHLVKELQNLKIWNKDIYNELLYYDGSVQKMDLPEDIKLKYKTAFEIKQSELLRQSASRGIYIDQTQSLNLFFDNPDFSKIYSAHIYGWRMGLKTGLYYLRSKVKNGLKFGIDIEVVDKIKKKQECNDEVCVMCSA